MLGFRWAAVASCCLVGLAHAADPPPLVTDRPDATESAHVVPEGLVQIEAGLNLARDNRNGEITELLEIPSTLVRVGLGSRAELRIGWDGYLVLEERSPGVDLENGGGGDAALGAKIELREEDGWRPQIALIFGTSLPTGVTGFSTERFDPGVVASFAHTLSDRVGLGYNVGAVWASEEEAPGDTDTSSVAVYSLSAGFGITDKLGGFVEVFGDVPMSAPGTPTNFLDGGFAYLVRPNVQLDAAIGVGLSDAAADRIFTAGVSFRLPN